MMTTRTRTDLTVPVALAAMVPLVALRLGVTFLRVKAKRRGAVRRFRRALQGAGMASEFADRLAAEYESYGRLRSYVGKASALRFLSRP